MANKDIYIRTRDLAEGIITHRERYPVLNWGRIRGLFASINGLFNCMLEMEGGLTNQQSGRRSQHSNRDGRPDEG